MFREEDAVSLDALASSDAWSLLLPVDRALPELKGVALTPQGAKKVANGVAPTVEDLIEPASVPLARGERARLYAGERMMAVAECDAAGRLRLLRVFN